MILHACSLARLLEREHREDDQRACRDTLACQARPPASVGPALPFAAPTLPAAHEWNSHVVQTARCMLSNADRRRGSAHAEETLGESGRRAVRSWLRECERPAGAMESMKVQLRSDRAMKI
jgi:hypothetical protein